MSLLEYFTGLYRHIQADVVTKPGVAFLATLIVGYAARSKAARRWMLRHPRFHLVTVSGWMEHNDRRIFRGLVGLGMIVFLFLYAYANYLMVVDAQAKHADELSKREVTIKEQKREIEGLQLRLDERRARRVWDLKKAHLDQLRPLLLRDAQYFTNIGEYFAKHGRVINAANKTPSAIEAELRSVFALDDVFTDDLVNHYPQYVAERDRLQKDVRTQEDEFDATILSVSRALFLGPHAEDRRMEVSRSLIWKCIGKGPATILVSSAAHYEYHPMELGGRGGNPPVPEDIIEAAKSFDSTRLAPEVITHCNNLKRRADSISARLKKLANDARQLAARTTLPGECQYTKPD